MIGGWLVLGGVALAIVVGRCIWLVADPLKPHEQCGGKGCSFCNWQGKRAKRFAKTVGRMVGRPLPDKIR